MICAQRPLDRRRPSTGSRVAHGLVQECTTTISAELERPAKLVWISFLACTDWSRSPAIPHRRAPTPPSERRSRGRPRRSPTPSRRRGRGQPSSGPAGRPGRQPPDARRSAERQGGRTRRRSLDAPPLDPDHAPSTSDAGQPPTRTNSHPSKPTNAVRSRNHGLTITASRMLRSVIEPASANRPARAAIAGTSARLPNQPVELLELAFQTAAHLLAEREARLVRNRVQGLISLLAGPTIPASSKTARCFETFCWDAPTAALRSFTLASPARRRSSKRIRIGSPDSAKAACDHLDERLRPGIKKRQGISPLHNYDN